MAEKQKQLACDQNSVSISFVPPNVETDGQNLDQLDPAFMYTKILKEILLTIDFNQSHVKDFIKTSRILFANDVNELKNVDKLEREYDEHSSIWWYTYPSFLHSTLNRALRLMEVDLIVSMGFFIRRLHEDIATLYTEQFGGHRSSTKLTVFRGHGLTQSAFDQLVKMEDGLLSFNNFLSTSTNREVSLGFAREMMETSELVGVLFVLNIDPTISSTPFANIRDVSYSKSEDEILFTMRSIFQIGWIKQVGESDRLWEVDLTLTGDDDPQLRMLTDNIREETSLGSKGWHRLGKLMYKLGQLHQAELLYKILLEQATTEREKAHTYHMLGLVANDEGKHTNAITFYEESIKIYEKILSPTDPELGSSYNRIGGVYEHMGEYSKALEYYEKDLAIHKETLPPNHPDLAASYNNIGLVYDKASEYPKALEYHEKALAIRKETLPPNHPDLATLYNNIGLSYNYMDEHSKALEYYEKALVMWQVTLPPNHPILAKSYNNIGSVYDETSEYSKALGYHEKALALWQKVLPPNHPDLALSYGNIGRVYDHMDEYSKALEYYEKSVSIKENNFPPNHPNLVNLYKSIGSLYNHMGE